MEQINPKAAPFYMVGNEIKCLLIHGFTASPSEMKPLGEYLHQEGYSIKAPLLPGHGTIPADLNQTTWADWFETVRVEAEALLAHGPVVVIGLSMGALLALEAGARIKGLAGVVSINAPLVLRNQLSGLVPLVKMFRDCIPKKIGDEYNNLEARGRFAYDCLPVNGYINMKKLAKDVVLRLKEIDIPTLVVQAGQDETVDPTSAKLLHRSLPAGREILWLPDSRHVATMGPELAILGEEIIDFISHITGKEE